MITLTQNIKIYVPSTIHNKPTCNIEQVNKFQQLLSGMFGGCTTYYTIGCYQSDSGEVIKEKINIIESFADQISDIQIECLHKEIKTLKNDMQQESIAFELNNKLYLI